MFPNNLQMTIKTRRAMVVIEWLLNYASSHFFVLGLLTRQMIQSSSYPSSLSS